MSSERSLPPLSAQHIPTLETMRDVLSTDGRPRAPHTATAIQRHIDRLNGVVRPVEESSRFDESRRRLAESAERHEEARAVANEHREKMAKRYLRRVGAGFLATVATVTAVVSGVKALVPDHHGPEQAAPVATAPELPGDKIERSNEGICNLSLHAEHLLATDCNILPPEFTEVRYKAAPEGSDQLLAPITDNRAPLATNEDLSNVPDGYQEAFEAALSDPYIEMIKQKFPIEIYQNVNYDAPGTPKAEENAFFDPEHDAIKFKFVANEPSEMYITWGSVRGILAHEGSHGVYDDWHENTKDTFTQNTLHELTNLWVKDMQIVYEQYRVENRVQLHQSISEMKKALTAKEKNDGPDSKLPDMIKALDTYGAQLDKPNGLSKLHIQQPIGDDIYPSGVSSTAVIARLSGTDGFDSYFTTPQEKQTYKEFDTPYRDMVKESFKFVTETDLDAGLTQSGGHPYDNVNERFASTMSTIQTNPEGVVAAIKDLPSNRREIQEQFITIISKQLEHDKQGVAAKTNIQFVLDRISQGQPTTSR